MLGQVLQPCREQCLCSGMRPPPSSCQVSKGAEQPLTGGTGNA